MRLNRFLASCGLGSRRACESLIRDGQVTVNGQRVEALATTISPVDSVRVSGKSVALRHQPITLAVYKPPGYLSARADARGRRTVYDLVPETFSKLFHVGRLDLESEGLMVLTDDGALAQRLSHPSHRTPKEYEVTLDGPLDPALIPRLLAGFPILGGRARMEAVRMIEPHRVRVVLAQGIKRQIRLMFYRMGVEVRRLIRTRIGAFDLGPLRPGQWKVLTPREIARLEADKIPNRPATQNPKSLNSR